MEVILVCMMSAAASVGIENIRAMRARLLDVTYIINLDFDKGRIITSRLTSKDYTTKCFRYQKLNYIIPSQLYIKLYCNSLGHILSMFQSYASTYCTDA